MSYLIAGGAWNRQTEQLNTRAAGLARLLVGLFEYHSFSRSEGLTCAYLDDLYPRTVWRPSHSGSRPRLLSAMRTHRAVGRGAWSSSTSVGQ